MTKRILLVFVLFFAGLPIILNACDTNIISLISGNTASDAFVEKSSKLVELATRIGQNIDSKEKTLLTVKELMKVWIDFDNRFSQFPPEWAKQDKEWKNKLRDLADRIGTINTTAKKDLGKTHDMVLDFSKKIMLLYEFLPKSNIGQQLWIILASLQKLADANAQKNAQLFDEKLKETVQALVELKQILPANQKPYLDEFGARLKALEELRLENPDEMSFKLKMVLMMADDAYIKMNEKLSASQTTGNN